LIGLYRGRGSKALIYFLLIAGGNWHDYHTWKNIFTHSSCEREIDPPRASCASKREERRLRGAEIEQWTWSECEVTALCVSALSDRD
jgi:hypothetical protein